MEYCCSVEANYSDSDVAVCCVVKPLNQDSSTVPSRRSSRASASSHGSTRERRLYRQGSYGSQIGGSGIELESLGSRGNFSYKSRTPSGKSIRSRVATRAEYHEDLKPQLSTVSPSPLASFYLQQMEHMK